MEKEDNRSGNVPLSKKDLKETGDSKEGKDKDIKSKKKTKKSHWAVKSFFLTILLSVAFSFCSEFFISGAGLVVSVLIVILLIFLNICFDIISVASATCDTSAFNAMAARKIKGAKEAIALSENAEIVQNICGDIIGDICGIVSGAAGAVITFKIVEQFTSIGVNGNLYISIAVSALIAGLTVGGKAICKRFAMDNANSIIITLGRFLSFFKKKDKKEKEKENNK